MSKATKKSILFALGVLVLIAFAMWLRYASRHIFHSPVANHLRSGIYVFLFSAWCYSLRIRIVQTQVRRYLVAISVLMVLWMLLRSIKFSIENTDAERWLWYFYYFPMLFIPVLSAFVSQSLGKGEDFRLPRWTKLLYLPTLLLLLLVLTNDLHQQVFSFPSGVLSDQEYRYESGYFFVLAWEALCAGFALLSMVKNCRIPRSRRIRWLPLVPLALSLAYACAYVKKVYWVWVLAGDMTVSLCLIFASILECCIQCGLIQSNLGYDELFEATSLPVQITDPAFCSQYVSVAMQGALPQGELRQMQQDTAHLDDDTLLKRHKLRRGWVFWKEDISALNQIRKELELTRDELRDTGDVLAAENAQHARWLKLTEENRLYDMMEAQTARQEAEFLQKIGCSVTYFDRPKQCEIRGDGRVESVTCDGRTIPAEGVFILRPTMAPTELFPGLAVEQGYVTVDRRMATNLPGLFAAGDCTGGPLQVSKAAGDGLIAGQSAAAWAAAQERREKQS